MAFQIDSMFLKLCNSILFYNKKAKDRRHVNAYTNIGKNFHLRAPQYPFTHSGNISNTFFIPETVPGVLYNLINKMDKNSCLYEAYILIRGNRP